MIPKFIENYYYSNIETNFFNFLRSGYILNKTT
jgi:hypothetical protein